jgi:hypothetical protein
LARLEAPLVGRSASLKYKELVSSGGLLRYIAILEQVVEQSVTALKKAHPYEEVA